MKRFVNQGIALTLNHYVSLDSEYKIKLAKLNNLVMLVKVVDWQMQFLCCIKDDGVHVETDEKLTPDLIVSGDLFNFLRTLAQGISSENLMKHHIKVKGDALRADRLFKTLQSLDINWQQQLAKYIGVDAAAGVSKGASVVREQATLVKNTMSKATGDYLLYEKEALVSHQENKEFQQAVTALRHRTERLQAKINKLKQSDA